MCCGILSSLACCVGSSACGLCCKACPSCKNSTSSRIVYALFLLFGTVVSCILLIPGVAHALQKIPGLCKGITENTPFNIIDKKGFSHGLTNCDLLVGNIAVYSICFGMICFFAFMALLMICVKSSKDPRASVQNGFWLFKFLAFVGPMVGGFFLPWKAMATPWMVIGMIGAFVFILIQLVLIVDFAHSFNAKFLEKAEEGDGHKGWYIALLVFTIFFFAVTLVATGLMYHFYGVPQPGKDVALEAPGCSRHNAFISVNLILVVIVTIVALLPKVREGNPGSGLLQPSIISLYVIYLTWSAITNDEACNPSLTEIYIQLTNHSHVANTTANSVGTWGQPIDGVSIITLVFWFVAITYASIRNSSHSSVGKLTLSQDEEVIIGDDDLDKGDDKDDDDSSSGQKVYDNEKNAVAYNYSWLHLMFMLAAFYIMMTLTNWYHPKFDTKGIMALETSVASMWVKISSSWACIAIYLWTLIAPLCCPNREFD